MILAIKILCTLVLAALCGWGWRLGGSANTHMRWIREVAVGVTEILCLWMWFQWSWLMLLIMGLAFTETTYFKKKGMDAKWWNWLLCGICYSLIPMPLLSTGQIHWQGFLIRGLVLTPVITLWRTFQGNVQWSEGGAGAWQILTLPLLLIK